MVNVAEYYFPRVFYKEEHFLRIVSLLFHIRNIGPSTLPFVTAPGLPDTQGQGRWKETEGWAGYKYDCEGKGTHFKCVAFCFPFCFLSRFVPLFQFSH